MRRFAPRLGVHQGGLVAARAQASSQMVQLPPVLVTGERASTTTAVQRLSQVVIVGQRSDAAPTVTARTGLRAR